jgi:hypothetical protein
VYATDLSNVYPGTVWIFLSPLKLSAVLESVNGFDVACKMFQSFGQAQLKVCAVLAF